MIKRILDTLSLLGAGLQVTDYAPYGSALYNLFNFFTAGSHIAGKKTPNERMEEGARQASVLSLNGPPVLYHSSSFLEDALHTANQLYESGVELSSKPNIVNAIDIVFSLRSADLHRESAIRHLNSL